MSPDGATVNSTASFTTKAMTTSMASARAFSRQGSFPLTVTSARFYQ